MERNKKFGHCLVCGCEVVSGEGYRRFVRGRGLRVVCVDHASNLMSYHGSEALRADEIGTEKKMPLTRTTIGVEIETDGQSRTDEKYLRFRGTLERVGFVFESDCSVRTGEAPSPKMQGLATMSAILRNNQDVFDLFTENTGSHIHVQCDDIAYIRRYYHTLFVPFCEYLESHSDTWLINNFGSDFRYYACKITRYTDCMNHANFINVQHEHTLEFRLPRIREYRQFVELLKFWREVGFFLNNFDFEKTSEATTRKRKASEAADEIVKIARKYFGD